MDFWLLFPGLVSQTPSGKPADRLDHTNPNWFPSLNLRQSCLKTKIVQRLGLIYHLLKIMIMITRISYVHGVEQTGSY